MSPSISIRRPGFRWTAFCALVMAGLWAAPASAQVRITGRVIDDVSERALAHSDVTILDRDGRVLGGVATDETGAFSFEVDDRIRAVRIDVKRLGYQSNTTPILYFDGREFFQVEIRLDVEAILIAPLEVVAWSRIDPSPLLDDFRRRVQQGIGFYITRDEIEQRKPMYITDMLRDVPGVSLGGGGTGTRPTVNLARASLPMSTCNTQIFVDGFLMNKRQPFRPGAPAADFRIDDLVSPASVEGIEIYNGVATVPAEFLNDDAIKCGVIAIWTRRGGRG
jgi:hypothetical protein